jgi:glyoxalase family protein
MRLDGIHHVTCITGDARANQGFYTGTLGLRRVKLTINQDSPSIRRDAKGGVWLNQNDPT